MTKIRYVIVQRSAYMTEGIVAYDNGTRKQYDLVTSGFPNTVKKFMETAKKVEETEENMGGGVVITTKTYEN